SQTPDTLAAALFVSGLVCFLESRDWPAGALFTSSILVRPDYIVFAGLLPAAFIFMRIRPPWSYLVTLICSLAIYWLALALAHYPGWWRQLVFAVSTNFPLNPPLTMVGFDPPFSLSTYFYGLSRGIMKILAGFDPWAWVAVGAGFALLYFRRLREQL